MNYQEKHKHNVNRSRSACDVLLRVPLLRVLQLYGALRCAKPEMLLQLYCYVSAVSSVRQCTPFKWYGVAWASTTGRDVFKNLTNCSSCGVPRFARLVHACI